MIKRPPAVFAKATKVFNIGLGEDESRLNSKVLPSGCCSRLSRMNVISYCSAALQVNFAKSNLKSTKDLKLSIFIDLIIYLLNELNDTLMSEL